MRNTAQPGWLLFPVGVQSCLGFGMPILLRPKHRCSFDNLSRQKRKLQDFSVHVCPNLLNNWGEKKFFLNWCDTCRNPKNEHLVSQKWGKIENIPQRRARSLQAVKMLPGMRTSCVTGPGSVTQLCFWSSFLLRCTLRVGGGRWWLKDLGLYQWDTRTELWTQRLRAIGKWTSKWEGFVSSFMSI